MRISARRIFRVAQIISVIPFIEFLINGSAWSVIPIGVFYIYLITGFRCKNCDANLIDKRIVSKIGNDLNFLDNCPNCGNKMY